MGDRVQWRGRTVASILSVAVFAVILAPAATAMPGPAGRPTWSAAHALLKLPTNEAFHPSACPLFEPEGLAEHDIECGTLTVPERHATATGRSIQLIVALIHAKDPATALEPVVFLEGGPGASAIVGLETWGGSSLLDRHDLILIEQRGTGFSKPSLACTELPLPADEKWTTAEVFDYYRKGVTACRTRLTGDGIDLAAYSTNENAADVDALRRALGIERWNLYGISYGTRLALEVMRDFPDGVRSAVLDSAYPPQIRSFENQGARLDRAFDALLAACAADAPCAGAYPGLGRAFRAEMDVLEAHEFRAFDDVPGHTIEVAFRSWLYQSQLFALLPALVHSAEIGNTAPFLPLFEPHQLISEADSLGMNLSVECAERGTRVDPAVVAADAAAHPRWRALLARDWDPLACDIWAVPPARNEDLEPVRSGIPTLIFAGDLDPVTPPAYATETASTLQHSQVVEVPGVGHGITLIACPATIRDAFFLDPMTPPDTSCVATMLPASGRFITDQVANAGLGRMYQRLLFGLNGPTIGHWVLATFVGLTFLVTLLVWAARALGTLIRARRRRRAAVAAALPGAESAPVADHSHADGAGIPRGADIVRRARWLGFAAIVVDVVFVVGLAVVLTGQPEPFARDLGLPVSAAWLIGLAKIGEILAGALAVVALAAILLRAGRRRTRIHVVALSIACLIVSGTLLHYGVI